MKTGQRIKERREALGLTQEALAELLNKGQKQIWEYESNRKLPSVGSLIELAQILQTSADYLLGLVDEINTEYIPEDERELITIYQNQTLDNRERILNVVKALV